MKGLLIKDLRILLSQRRFMLIVGFACLLFLFVNNDPSFTIGYLSFMFAMLALLTLSMDEMNNGYAFLFTLPISRKTYILEKYVLLVAISFFACAVSTLVCCGINLVKKEPASTDILTLALVVFLCIIIFLAIFTPIQLKFTAERSRIVMICIVGAAIAAVALLERLILRLGINVNSPLPFLESLSFTTYVISGIIFGLVSLGISYAISLHIMENKEF